MLNVSQPRRVGPVHYVYVLDGGTVIGRHYGLSQRAARLRALNWLLCYSAIWAKR